MENNQNNQNNNQNKKWVNFASGWLKEGKDGNQYVSCKANGSKEKIKIYAELEDGSLIPVENFIMRENGYKNGEKSPDYRFGLPVDSQES